MFFEDKGRGWDWDEGSLKMQIYSLSSLRILYFIHFESFALTFLNYENGQSFDLVDNMLIGLATAHMGVPRVQILASCQCASREADNGWGVEDLQPTFVFWPQLGQPSFLPASGESLPLVCYLSLKKIAN